MTVRYLPHLSYVILLHLLALLASWQLIHNDKLVHKVALSSGVIKIKIAQSVILPVSVPVKKIVTSVTKPLKKQEQTQENKSEVLASAIQQELISEQGKTDIRESYKAELRMRIESNKYYPMMSRRLGHTGIVIVAFTLLEDGHIINVRIDTPSRYEGLNASALDAVKKVHLFRPIPKELGETRMDIKVPLKYVTI